MHTLGAWRGCCYNVYIDTLHLPHLQAADFHSRQEAPECHHGDANASLPHPLTPCVNANPQILQSEVNVISLTIRPICLGYLENRVWTLVGS